MRTLILFVLFLITIGLKAQHLKIKGYSAGYRAFEIDAVGNNPLTITPFLKDPEAYQNYISQIQYNGLYGNPGVQILRNYYFNTEWCKDAPESRFWKRHTIQFGIFLSNQLTKDNMALTNERLIVSSNDTTFFRDQYSLIQKQQFLGANAGINRRIKISGKLQFLTGFYLQGSCAFLHKYEQWWDSSVYYHQIWTTKTTEHTELKGKNFLQWQAMIPLGLELNAFKNQIYLRAELDLGIIGDRYRRSGFLNREAHGYGFWIIYHTKN